MKFCELWEFSNFLAFSFTRVTVICWMIYLACAASSRLWIYRISTTSCLRWHWLMRSSLTRRRSWITRIMRLLSWWLLLLRLRALSGARISIWNIETLKAWSFLLLPLANDSSNLVVLGTFELLNYHLQFWLLN